LKSPTSSFLASTDTTGWPRRWRHRTRPLMYSKWALQSGWAAPPGSCGWIAGCSPRRAAAGPRCGR
jgi:hypothetical protein